MSTTQIRTEMTPNPNAWKFVVDTAVIGAGSATFSEMEQANDIPLAKALLETGHVTQVFFLDNFITVTQDGDIDWNILADVVRAKIEKNLPAHNPAAVKSDSSQAPELKDNSELMGKIEEILNETIRPALQGDGGDLQILEFNPDTKVLKIHYQGACGSCPSATTGTMFAIQGLLQDQVDPEIRVSPA